MVNLLQAVKRTNTPLIHLTPKPLFFLWLGGQKISFEYNNPKMKSDGPNPVAFGVKKWPYFAQKKYVEFPTISVSFEKKKKKKTKKSATTSIL